MQFYEKDLSSNDTVSREFENLFLALNTWEFEEGEAVPRDYEDLLQFLKKFNLMSSFTKYHYVVAISAHTSSFIRP